MTLEERLIDLGRFGSFDPAGRAFSRVCDLPHRSLFEFFGSLSVTSNLYRATIRVGTPLNSKRLVVNIADDMSLRLQNYLSSLDRTFDFPSPPLRARLQPFQ